MAAPEPVARRRRWTAVPAADRVRQRRELLLAAAFEILGDGGWSALTIRSVIDRAGLNVRYFYESFTDVDGLAVAVYDGVFATMSDTVISALASAGQDPARQTRAMVEATVRFVDEDRRRGRVLYVEGLGSEALNKRRAQAGQAVVAFVERHAVAQAPAPPADDPIGRAGGSVIVGGFSQLLIDWLAGRISLTRDELIDDATTLLLALGETAVRIAATRRSELPGVGRDGAGQRGHHR